MLIEYSLLIILAALFPIFIYIKIADHLPILYSSVIALFALPSIHCVYSNEDGQSLNQALAYTGKILILYGVIFSIGWIL